MVGKALSDPSFVENLRQNAQKAIEDRFGKQPYAIRVIYPELADISLLVPHKTSALEQVANRTVADLGNRQPTGEQANALLMQRVVSKNSINASARPNLDKSLA